MGPIDVVTGAYMVTPCDHLFHEICLSQWMDLKMECPVCRASLPPVGGDGEEADDGQFGSGDVSPTASVDGEGRLEQGRAQEEVQVLPHLPRALWRLGLGGQERRHVQEVRS